jgi:hypothetical protein
MRAVRRRLRLYAWLALLAIAALAICPTVSRVFAPDGSAAPPLLGTGAAHAHHHHHDGTMQAATTPVAPHVPSHQHSLEHCGFCVLAAHAFAVAPAPTAMLASSDCGRRAEIGRAPAVPRLRCDWSPASSRGPPLS